MKKTFSININGLLFNIDEDAFEKLNNYLKTLKKHFKNTEGGDDIVNDIEARIAEILKSRMKDAQQIATEADVDFAIETLGQPFEMDEEHQSASGSKSRRIFSKKRIFRDPDNQILGGVASGLAAYFNIDPVIIRLLFVLSILVGGVGLVVYLTLWILTPYASTTAEKIEMEGDKVDIHSIEKKVREEIESLKTRFQDFSDEAGDVLKKKKKESVSGLNQFGSFLIKLLRVVFRSLAILIGILFLLIGIALSITFAATYLGITPSLQFEDFSIEALSFPAFINTYLITTPYELILNVSLILVIVIPIIGLMYNGIRLIFNLGRQKILGLTAVILWVLALIIAFTLSVKTMEQFKTEAQEIHIDKLDSLRSDTLKLAIYNESYYRELEHNSTATIYIDNEKVMLSYDQVFYGHARLHFRQAVGDQFEVISKNYARGKNRYSAEERLKNTKYHYEIQENTLLMDPYFTLKKNEKWRGQELNFEIRIPEGKSIYIAPAYKNYYGCDNWRQSPRRLAGGYWTMQNHKLVKSKSK
jgi:phage shock protein PspC (stress-responsive transcriptional regulator)